MKSIRVVAAIIKSVSEAGEPVVFATQRGYGEYKDWWEFPGGKIEGNETPEDALVREIKEELDAVINVDDYLITVEYDYPEFHLSMDCFWCRSNGRDCPYCNNKKVLSGYNDLATVNPNLAKQWHPTKNGDLTPQMVTKGSNKKVWWQCSLGHEWQANICNRSKSNGTSCPYCSGKKVLAGFNDLLTVNPILASEWSYKLNSNLTPDMVTANSNQKVWWECNKGHVW